MKPKTSLIVSLVGTIILALCCFTPILVILLGALGLSAIVIYLDHFLLPALGIFLVMTVFSFFRYRKSHPNNKAQKMSETCCSENQNALDQNCPVNNIKGKPVKTITLKSLLVPEALETLNPQSNYFFCESNDCPVVYFNQQGKTFITNEIKVPVFQKDSRNQVPVCYCFGWTRERILQEIKLANDTTAESSIRTHVKAKRCGCEVNNPQGSCCLANVRKFANLAK